MNTKKNYQPPFVLTRTIAQMTEQAAFAIEQGTGEGENWLDGAISATLAIEGNKLTAAQIREIREGKYPDASAREIREGEGAIAAYSRLDRWDPQSEADMLDAHISFVGGFSHNAGSYRTKGARIVNGTRTIHVAPPPDRVPELMEDLMEWLARDELHPIQKALVFHYEFEFIHPFAEGNGWLGRLWQRAVLRDWNAATTRLSLESALLERRGEYFQSLKLSTRQTDCASYVEFALRSILRLLGMRFIEAPDSVHSVHVGQYSPSEDTDNTLHPPTPLPDVLEPAEDAATIGGGMGFRIGTIPAMPLIHDTHLADTAAEMARLDEAMRIAEIMGRAENQRQCDEPDDDKEIIDERSISSEAIAEVETAIPARAELHETPPHDAGEASEELKVDELGEENAGEAGKVRIQVEAVYVPEYEIINKDVVQNSDLPGPANKEAQTREADFVSDTLEVEAEKIVTEMNLVSDAVLSTENSPVPQISQATDLGPHVPRLLRAFDGEMSGAELQEELGLRDRKSFRERYITPALKEGLIEMTIPDKPNSRLQKYRLTEKAKSMGVL